MLALVASALAGGDCIDTPMRCAGVVRPALSVAWSRRHPRWEPSCAASVGACQPAGPGEPPVAGPGLARCAARIYLGEWMVTTKTPRRRFFSFAGRLTRAVRRLTLHPPPVLAMGGQCTSRPSITTTDYLAR